MRIARVWVMLFVISSLSLARHVAAQAADAPPPGAAAGTPAGPADDAATRPTTRPTTRSTDPLATPESAIAHLFTLIEKRDGPGVRQMMADPQSIEHIQPQIAAVARRLEGGATWEVVDSHIAGSAAIVLFRTKYPDGKEDISPLMFVNHYDRWKVLLGQLNARRFTSGEKEGLTKAAEWGAKRIEELRGGNPTTTAPSGEGTQTGEKPDAQ